MPVNPITYDELPYIYQAMPYAQPDRLATLATLFGMTPPAIVNCRVLELGCGDGSNLIATAYRFPQSECVGIDLAAANLAKGQAIIHGVGLPNLTLKRLNILEVDEHLGQFDYIIAHGIFSWVSQAVQEKIFRICKQQLVANGVAYISYHTSPGWKIRDLIRDMMLYYTTASVTETRKEEQLKTLLKFLADTTADSPDPYDQLVNREVQNLGKLPTSFVFREWLEEEPQACYFHEFIERVKHHGLAYLADAFLPTMLPDNFSAPIAEKLQLFNNDLVYLEQAMDLLRNRQFRHTLLCHQGIQLKRGLSSEKVKNFHIASSLRPVADHPGQFENSKGNLNSSHSGVQSAMHHLSNEWPRSVAFSDLVTAETDANAIANALLIAYAKGLIELYSQPLQLAIEVSDYPQASSLARWQIKQSNQVTNLRCETVVIEDPTCSYVLPYLDGTRDRHALVELFHTWIKQGLLEIQTEPGVELTDLPTLLGQLLDAALQRIAKYALLVA